MKMRIHVMSLMRGVEPFEMLWDRRQMFEAGGQGEYNVLSLPDLVLAKKTQRDKDWPMIRRLIEADYVGNPNPAAQKVSFWLKESRTPGMLVDLCMNFRELALSLRDVRSVLGFAEAGESSKVEAALEREEKAERQADREYWEPLRRELEMLRGVGFESEEEV
jgi:hypothetical protein